MPTLAATIDESANMNTIVTGIENLIKQVKNLRFKT